MPSKSIIVFWSILSWESFKSYDQQIARDNQSRTIKDKNANQPAFSDKELLVQLSLFQLR